MERDAGSEATDSAVRNNRDLIALVVILAVGTVVFHLWMAARGQAITRDQHLGAAVEYARSHIDLLRPVLLGFNANGAPTPLEFPIWHAITAALMKMFGVWFGWGNVASLAFHLTSLCALFDLARRIASVRAAWWALVFFLGQPLSIIYGGAAGADSTSWAFAVWFLYFAYRMLNNGGWRWWFPAAVAGSLSAVTKAPFFAAVGLTTFFWVLYRHRASPSAWFQLASAGAASGLMFALWNGHCQRTYAEAILPLVDLNPLEGRSDARSLYFGTVQYRLAPGNTIRVGWTFLTYVLGNLAFVPLLLIGLRLSQARMALLSIAAAVLTTAIFTPLIVLHVYYSFIFSAGTALLLGCVTHYLEPGVWRALGCGTGERFSILCAGLLFSIAQASQLVHINLHFDRYRDEAARILKEQTKPTEKLIVFGPLWGEPFLRADRQGRTGAIGLERTSLLSDAKQLAEFRKQGFTKAVLMNPSPYLVALTTATGTGKIKSRHLPDLLPPNAKDWPVAFNSPNMLIVELPSDVQ